MLAAIDMKRGRNVFIANIVKCRPPGNREPTTYEAQQCEPYLARQIELIRPKLIIALGKVAAQNLLGTMRVSAAFAAGCIGIPKSQSLSPITRPICSAR